MEEAPATDSFEDRRKIFKDVWDGSDTNALEEHKPKVIKTARLSNNAIAIRKKRIKKLKSACKKVLELSDRNKYIQEETTSIGTRKTNKYRRIRRRRKTVKKIKSTSSCKSCSKSIQLMNDVMSEGKTNSDEASTSIAVVTQKEDIGENTKKFIKPARVEDKRPKSPVRFNFKQPAQVRRELATLTTINLCINR